MRLETGGIDVFYIDESMDGHSFAICSLAVPFLRNVEGTWSLVWEDQFENIRDWRRAASRDHGIPVGKELKGQKLASGRGRYLRGKHQFSRSAAAEVYRALLAGVGFLSDMSVISVVGKSTSNLYGSTRLQALVHALLQRLRTACSKMKRNGLVFFDEGHGEYRKLYRRARVYLPTGSSRGTWNDGAPTKNLPLDNFTKDANIKQSEHSYFIQLVDLVVFSLLLKIRAEEGKLTAWQDQVGLGSLYDAIPQKVLNTAASTKDPQGIVRL